MFRHVITGLWSVQNILMNFLAQNHSPIKRSHSVFKISVHFDICVGGQDLCVMGGV